MNAKTIRVQVVDADPSGGQDLPELSVPSGNVLSERFGMVQGEVARTHLVIVKSLALLLTDLLIINILVFVYLATP